MIEYLPLALFLSVCLVLMLGYPVAFSLGGTALIFAAFGTYFDVFDGAFLTAFPNRLYGIMTNQNLIAVPLFVFMGVILEKSKIAEGLLFSMAKLFGRKAGGLSLSVILVGMLLAASTGIVGATVVTMGLLSLPAMLKKNYDPQIATGVICASGTLGQIIPPSIILVLLGDVLSSAYQQAQLDMGVWAPKTVSVADLFVGAIIPGLILVSLYFIYIIYVAITKPERMPALADDELYSDTKTVLIEVSKALIPPFILIVAVLGSILTGKATPSEASAVGALGGLLLAIIHRKFTLKMLAEVCQQTTKVTSMVFMIFIGAAIFSLVFRGFAGDEMVTDFLSDMPGGTFGAVALVMLVMFLLGFILDFIEITFVIVPIVGPVLLAMGLDPIWLGIMIALNLQTSFLTPPFGFALFYLRGVAPPEIKTTDIYKGVMPFIVIQLIVLGLLAYWPILATGLPHFIYPD